MSTTITATQHGPVPAAGNGRTDTQDTHRNTAGDRRANRDSKQQTLKLSGLPVSWEFRQLERDARISPWRAVQIAPQTRPPGFVVRGVESGGAIAQLGHYVTFAALDGSPLEWLQPLDSIGANQTHAVVVAPSLVRIEVLRVHRTYELAITSHKIQVVNNHPKLVHSMLFRGTQGFLGLELWDKDQAFRGEVLPAFYNRGGDEQPIPPAFEQAVKAAVQGACCIGCRDSHYLRAVRTTAAPAGGAA